MIDDLIESLRPNERQRLEALLAEKPNQLHSFVAYLLAHPKCTQQELQKALKLSAGTVFKNLSLAKDIIYDVIKQEIKSPYDDLMLPHTLYKRGLSVQASKQRLKMESEYEQQGWWNILQESYNYELLVAYAACDVAWLERIEKKAAKNIERLQRYVLLSNRAIVLMAKVERGDLKPREIPALISSIRATLQRAARLHHPVPQFNLLHTLFVIYTSYDINVEKAGQVIQQIHKLVESYDEKLIPYARSVAWLNSLGFYADFATHISPLEFWEKTESAIKSNNLLYDSQALLSFCSFHFYEGDVKSFQKNLTRFETLPFEKSFLYKSAYLRCLKAYMLGDRELFRQSRDEFYQHEENRAYQDYDLVIRYLEVMLLVKDSEHSVARDKLQAAVKFVRRNFSPSRIQHEQRNWEILNQALKDAGRAATRVIKKSKRSGSALITKKTQAKHNVFRLSQFLSNEADALAIAQS